MLLPLNVSFAHIAIEEVPCDTGFHSGYFADLSMTNNWSHTYSRGAGRWVKVGGHNILDMQDRVSCGACPPPWVNGTLIWDIPFGWSELDAYGNAPSIGTPPIKEFGANVHHTITINPSGTVIVMKLERWIMRNVFDEIVLDGVVVKEGEQ